MLLKPHGLKYIFLFFLFFSSISTAQLAELKGRITDAITQENIVDALVSLEKTDISTTTNVFGVFDFKNLTLPIGEQILVVSAKGYITKRFPVTISEGFPLNLKNIELDYDFKNVQQQIGTISLSDVELNDDNDAAFNMSWLLQASRDVFLNAAAFDFSTTFFRPRGLNNENGKVLINGIEMNKLSNGRPQWANWGGLNDVQRNQEYSFAISQNDYAFGDLLGTSNIIMRASKYRKGARISYASSNRSYQGRVMATYNSGVNSKGWAFSISASRRFGEEGFIDGTGYDSNSFFVSIEKKINKNHSLNLTGFYTPNRRGRSTAITEEVFNIMGSTYNPNWGYQGGKTRNSRERRVEEPVVMLNHYWDINKNTNLNSNIAFQTGKIADSRIDTGGSDLISTDSGNIYLGGGRGANTNPVHPDNLPSSFLKETNITAIDYQNAFLAQQNLINNGQLQWDQLIKANQQNAAQGNNATYILYEDRTDDTQLTGNLILNSRLNKHFTINAALNYRNLKSQNFAEVKDLLGGSGFLDIDMFALSASDLSTEALENRAQSDLQNPNRIVQTGDRYDYNYEIYASTINGYAQAQFKYKKINFFLAGDISQASYQRNGLFENGYFPRQQSLGKSPAVEFKNYGIKGGARLRIHGHHSLDLNTAYFTKAPSIRNTFVNARQSNASVSQLIGNTQENEKIESIDASYIFRSSKIKAKITGYYTKILDASNISFFFTQAISGSGAGFVQEILTDVDKLHIGGELGIEYQITPTIKLKSAAAVGQFTYNNNPELALASTSEIFTDFQGIRSFGKSALKGYYLSGGPQNAAQLGFEYRDPNFWWFGATTNYFSNAFISVSPFARTSNFNQDEDGLPFNDYDETIAKSLLQQERFDDYILVNAIGGKSWRIKKYYVGFFASINNVLDQKYRTGGFEQTRNANYRRALEESQRETPVFGPKYYYGFGTSYYLNFYIRF
ncbi:carboxypeptidase-like regulatory domain-containing protein [Aquimarina celericrescens]|uniref:Carboxypeptidase-like regulatory domain-containing protein n=1 Tax=Aquimarina celericrescens TaxID=1964542 RepID=A0ABW5AUU0_9FLAO|nr:TonB-dependent receptor [Aquimarina celericrescens]